jgi:hypothetical protein
MAYDSVTDQLVMTDIPVIDTDPDDATLLEGPLVDQLIGGCLAVSNLYDTDVLTTINTSVILAATSTHMQTPVGTAYQVSDVLPYPPGIDTLYEQPVTDQTAPVLRLC